MATHAAPPPDVLSKDLLVKAFNNADPIKALCADGRSRPTDPISPIHRAAKAVGWKFLRPNIISNDGHLIHLLHTSPAELYERYKVAYQNILEHRGGPKPSVTMTPTPCTYSGSRIN